MRGTTFGSLRRTVGEGSGQGNWARIWFAKLARFHRINQPEHWQFTEQHVIEVSGGVRCARPPANRLYPFGI